MKELFASVTLNGLLSVSGGSRLWQRLRGERNLRGTPNVACGASAEAVGEVWDDLFLRDDIFVSFNQELSSLFRNCGGMSGGSRWRMLRDETYDYEH